ncbi:hypothetical protein GCM10008015_04500 [Flavobacterium palustre]|jgi:hypothetical protein|uniref:Lipocalin-like domain-containing protein n=1 Tax=Flavobacterium palustre TaxID=1476463 RepID=A0ABQ1HAS4_9FLAO|nr:hypothetical protein [Flavobacterium palustre]GGA66875.1 hypothetical protein GCM10008015_04500 [Flavobacterium palustre]
MKKSQLFIFGAALLTALIISCNQKRNNLVNTWKVTGVEAKTPQLDSVKNDILSNGTLTFTKDGHVSGYLESEINDGTYALTKKGKNLVIKDENGTPFSFESTITDDQVILDSDKMKITLSSN